jgi:hypothetical protein
MTDITVERLTLRVSGVSVAQAAELGRQLAEGLGRADLSWASPARVDHVGVRVPTGGTADARRLAERAVAEILRELRRAI